MSEFVHLHVHTQYSTLDGALRVKELVGRVAELKMPAVAVTDHANMFGAIQLIKYAKEAGVAPILGCEINVARPPGPQTTRLLPVDHLVLLAASEEGYRNLLHVVSRGHTHPVSDTAPSIALDWLDGRTRGLVALTGCMGGLVQQRILEEGAEAGGAMLGRLGELFDKDHLFVEIQDHGLPEQPVVNGILADLARRAQLPLVASNVVHFRDRHDGEAQLVLQCIQTGRAFQEAKAAHHGSYEMFLKSPAEMAHALRDYPDSLKATLTVAEMCTGWKLALGTPMLPNFAVPEGFDTAGYFRHVSKQGLEQRFAEFEKIGKSVDHAAYRARLESELDVICGMQFPGYFLIVWDFIRYAKENDIPVGPGRGSGAGSLVAYALRITDLDPIPYDLLFERFLNPERVSMPDFDVDFCMDKRDQVIAYVAKKYGETSVGQIATFHELKARSVIKDVARAMGFEPIESQRIASLIPVKGAGQTYTIPEVLQGKLEPKLTALYETDARVRTLLEQAQRLEGLTRHAGMHAAGVVISEGPLWDHVPVFVNGAVSPQGPDADAALVTQYYKDDVELAGLVKFDFLGLKTLTVMDICVRLVRARPDHKDRANAFELNSVPLDDLPTYQLLQSGETTGVFQLESSGMQQLFRDLKPDCFEDIVAAVALYRPGPLETGMVRDFVECKHGRQPIKKMHPLIDELLRPTYGVIVYQEQVMQIAQKLANYTLGGADLLRRAMGKKKPEEMAKQKGKFVEGAEANGVLPEKAAEIFDLVEKFAGYGFNKSHSAAYALITYQTAYLKAHYPVEFLCALMTADKDKIEKVVRIIAESQSRGVPILPPDINQSDTDFKVVYASPNGDAQVSKNAKVKDPYGPQIRFGLGAVRGVGGAALEAVFEARDAGGPFSNLFDFAARVDAKRINRGVLESLVQCGAFDTSLAQTGIHRGRAFAAIDRALERSRTASKDRERGQTNLFALMAGGEGAAIEGGLEDFPPCDPWDFREILVREKESLGYYVSGHPLDRYGKDMTRFDVLPTTALASLSDWSEVRVAGMVENFREKVFRGGGGKMAFFELEDVVGRVKVKVRDKQLTAFGDILTSGEPVMLLGKISFPQSSDESDDADSARDPTLFLNEARPLAEAIYQETKSVTVRLSAQSVHRERLALMRQVLEESPGSCHVRFVVEIDPRRRAVLSLPKDCGVRPSDKMIASLERIFGQNVAELG